MLFVVCSYRSKKEEHVPENCFVKPYQAHEEVVLHLADLACEGEVLHLADLDLFHLKRHVTLRAQLYPDSF